MLRPSNSMTGGMFLLQMRVTAVLLLLVLLIAACPSLVGAQVISDKASILDTQYTMNGSSLLLTVKVGYSYSHEQNLKLVAESYSPSKSYSKTFIVGPGTDVKSVDFEMVPPSGVSTWEVAISLYLSNQRGDTLELLHLKNIDINLGGSDSGSGGLLLLIGLVVIIAALYYGGRKKKPPPEPKKRHR
jgi:hypothetical protein